MLKPFLIKKIIKPFFLSKTSNKPFLKKSYFTEDEISIYLENLNPSKKDMHKENCQRNFKKEFVVAIIASVNGSSIGIMGL